MKQTILIKISGESFKHGDELVSQKRLDDLASQIKTLSKNYNIGIVTGGGNLMRGGKNKNKLVKRFTADQVGMLATVMNSLQLRDAIESKGVNVTLYSLISMPQICKVYNVYNMRDDLHKGKVVIFAGGTGSPYFTTDSGIALRALESEAHYILMGKNGVDGVYTADPKTHKNAKRLSKVTFYEAIEKKLNFMDLAAMAFLDGTNTNILVFDVNQPNCFVKVLSKKIPYTLVTSKGK
ncbi:MAG: UMP kinase [Malacoplasma sp.]|nr:UMP kinase [Malacoplasma sp.]